MRHRLAQTMHLYPWVRMVMFSELACFGPLLQYAQPLPGTAEEEFQQMAASHRIWLVNGSMYERKDGLIYNTTTVIDPNGEIIGRYRKMFPFLPMERGVAPGTDFLIFDIEDIGRFGVLNCYDIWFPETVRQLTSLGVEVILHPVMTHTPDRDLDLTIAHAASAMFQAYVIDINGLGAGGNGRSAVFDPSGRLLYQCDASEQTVPIEIDLQQVRHSRENGIRGFGQVLKSYRDRPIEFSVYDRQKFDSTYLNSLGPLVQPQRADLPSADVAPLPVRRSMLK
jgi:predicted amidohydrolase